MTIAKKGIKSFVWKEEGSGIIISMTCGNYVDEMQDCRIFSEERAQELLEIEKTFLYEREEMKKFAQGFAYKKPNNID